MHKIQQKLCIVKQEKCLHLNYFYLTTPRTDATSSVQVNHSTENILFVTSVYIRLFNQPRKSNSSLAGARLGMARQLVHVHQDNTAASRNKARVALRVMAMAHQYCRIFGGIDCTFESSSTVSITGR